MLLLQLFLTAQSGQGWVRASNVGALGKYFLRRDQASAVTSFLWDSFTVSCPAQHDHITCEQPSVCDYQHVT